MTSEVVKILILIILVLLSSFFSSAETALTCVSRIRVQNMAEEGDPRAQVLLEVLDHSAKMLSTILIGNNIVNMAASALMTTITIELLGSSWVGAATGLLTLLILLFGEITPKTLATHKAETIALFDARIIRFLMMLFSPAIWVIEKLSRAVYTLIRVDPDAPLAPVTEGEIRTMVKVGEQEGAIENEEKEMINNVFDLGDSCVSEVMIPRIDMSMLDVETTQDELLEIFRENMHTRYPVYENSIDNVIGIINIKDLLFRQSGEQVQIRDILREAFFTYEYKKTAQLLVEMRRESAGIAVVLDEYGTTAGLVTLEDLLEEIVGEIRDEYDQDEQEDLKEITSGREYQALGNAKLDDLNEDLGLAMESEDNDSIGGYIMEKLDRLPGQGDHLTLENGTRLVVDDMDKNRISLVHIWIPEKEEVTSTEKTEQ